jgi:hypothetical protein
MGTNLAELAVFASQGGWRGGGGGLSEGRPDSPILLALNLTRRPISVYFKSTRLQRRRFFSLPLFAAI